MFSYGLAAWSQHSSLVSVLAFAGLGVVGSPFPMGMMQQCSSSPSPTRSPSWGVCAVWQPPGGSLCLQLPGLGGSVGSLSPVAGPGWWQVFSLGAHPLRQGLTLQTCLKKACHGPEKRGQDFQEASSAASLVAFFLR